VLLAQVSADYPAYRAQIQWQLGVCHLSRADWGGAITLLQESAAGFERLGETGGAAGARRHLAVVYDRIGDPQTAWNQRVAALRGVGHSSNRILAKALGSIAEAAILRREWSTAESFLSLEIAVVRRTSDDVLLGDALLLRAVVRDRLHHTDGVTADLSDAKAAAARSKDDSYRAYLRIATLRATAMLSSTSPAHSDVLLTEALQYQAARSDLLMLPALHLERARARRKRGDSAGAISDVRLGIAELERHRDSLPAGEARWGAFHASEELFDDAIELALDSGDAEAAFRFAEQARARALLDSYGRSPVLAFDRLPADTVIVEYAALASRLIVFTADRAGVRATAVEYGRDALAADVDALMRAFRRGTAAAIATRSAALYRRLIAPVETTLRNASMVVFVPDAAISVVPFSALKNAHGEYLIERHAVVVAPSAASYAAAAERRRDANAPRAALVVSTSAPGAGLGPLTFVRAEARRVADAYATAERLTDDEAELDRLVARSPFADVIHFSGHAVGDDSGIDAASIVMRHNGRERRVSVAELAKLRLRRTSTVVLAGCSTARGERRAAEGVISVAHGFLTAGAPSVIATLWDIDDADAALFFPRLHRRLAEGRPPADALRQVQLEAIRAGDVRASLWAAVQNIGS
jgi:CHAT domain-containing protein